MRIVASTASVLEEPTLENEEPVWRKSRALMSRKWLLPEDPEKNLDTMRRFLSVRLPHCWLRLILSKASSLRLPQWCFLTVAAWQMLPDIDCLTKALLKLPHWGYFNRAASLRLPHWCFLTKAASLRLLKSVVFANTKYFALTKCKASVGSRSRSFWGTYICLNLCLRNPIAKFSCLSQPGTWGGI